MMLSCCRSSRLLSNMMLSCCRSSRLLSNMMLSCCRSSRLLSNMMLSCCRSSRLIDCIEPLTACLMDCETGFKKVFLLYWYQQQKRLYILYKTYLTIPEHPFSEVRMISLRYIYSSYLHLKLISPHFISSRLI